MKKQFIYKMMLLLLAAHFLIYGCGTKTKNKSQELIEIKSDENSKLEENKKYFDSIKTVLIEEARKEFSEISKENSKEEASKITTIETKETVFDDYRQVPNTRFSVEDRTGRIIETKTIIEEKFKLEKQKEVEIKKIEQERKTKDCLAVIKISETKISLLEKKLDSRIDKLEKETVQKGWRPGFWFWFWIILIILLIIAYFVFRKWLLIQFPWLSIIYKRKL